MPFEFNTTKERSELMKKIRSSGTKPEVDLGKALWGKGYRYRKHYGRLPGKPDFVFVKNKVAVFIDGEFWHGFNWNEKKAKIKANRDYWIPKIEKTIKRDRQNNKLIKKMSWKVLRFWEKQVTTDLGKCIKRIERALQNGAKSKI
jgi:DNA mismatch endonuclease (patch repair protein)